MINDMKFHHIGVVTDDISKTSKFYLDVGYNKTKIVYDPLQKVNIIFLSKKSMPTIELLEPTSLDSPVTKTLKKSGVSPYHLCYSVKDINLSVKELRKKKFIPLFKPVSAVALDMKKICFLYNKNLGLIELVEE